jgi:hypothetical protein
VSNSGVKVVAVDRWQVTRGRKCDACKARIAWCVVVKSHKRMPFNEPLRVLGESDDALMIDLESSHFSTCPQRDRFSRRGRQRGDHDGV